jgi:pantoate--beta-alanine ligase
MPTPSTDRLTRLSTPIALSRWALRCHASGMSVGMVPTMGALHEGHLSLVRRALAECDRVVVTIFVNPSQFAPGEDFERYPRDLEADLDALREAGVDAVFVPSVEVMYPPGQATRVQVTGLVAERLEAVCRAGHLEGVALVVTKLFVAGRPDRAYFGQKDAQQCAVVRRLAVDLDTGVEVVVCPTVREADGLALSSRNAYLSAADRVRAQAIPAGLSAAAEAFARGERSGAELAELARRPLAAVAAAIDYIEVVDPDTFERAEIAGTGCQILVAARMGTTRLIDALRLGLDNAPVAHGVAEQVCSESS